MSRHDLELEWSSEDAFEDARNVDEETTPNIEPSATANAPQRPANSQSVDSVPRAVWRLKPVAKRSPRAVAYSSEYEQ